MSDRMDINRLLMEMRSIKSQTHSFNSVGDISGDLRGTNIQLNRQVNGPTFGTVLTEAIDKVNSIQQESGAMSEAYIKGAPGVDITDVMIASQKSAVAFAAMTEVRNKVVEAYKDVMNMPI